MTIKWSFSYNSFVKLSRTMDPKRRVIKGLHCKWILAMRLAENQISS